jgi:hypothetical protein
MSSSHEIMRWSMPKYELLSNSSASHIGFSECFGLGAGGGGMESITALPLFRWFLVEAAQLSNSVPPAVMVPAAVWIFPAHNELRKATRSLFCLSVKAIWNR